MKDVIPSCPASTSNTAVLLALLSCRQAQQEGMLKQSSAGETLGSTPCLQECLTQQHISMA
jgi:hypothetical protein